MIAKQASPDLVTGVTYGGVAMSLVNGEVVSGAEPGRCYVFFLGSGIPTGAQTVVMGGTATVYQIWSATLTAASDTEVAASGTQTSTSAANPSITLATVAAYTGIAFGVCFSGQNAPSSLTAGSGYTKLSGDRDFGSTSATAEYGAKSGASVVVNYTATAEDVAFVAAAVRELGGAIPMLVTAPYLPQGWNR